MNAFSIFIQDLLSSSIHYDIYWINLTAFFGDLRNRKCFTIVMILDTIACVKTYTKSRCIVITDPYTFSSSQAVSITFCLSSKFGYLDRTKLATH